MSDSIPAEITIGGDIKESDIQKLAKLIEIEAVSLEWGENSFAAWQAEELIRQAAANKGCLRLCDDQASNGTFMVLEEFLSERSIDFDRHSDAKYEYDAEIVFCRDGGIVMHYSNQTGNEVLIPVSPIREMQEEVDEGLKNGADAIRLIGDIFARILPNVPKLKPITIVEG